MAYCNSHIHKSVLLTEVINFLNPQDDDLIIDGTFGQGGYSSKILESSKCKVIAFDQDPDVKIFADKILENFGPERFNFINDKFSNIKSYLKDNNIRRVDGLVLDLGVSSMQLDEPSRGFSFMHDAKLDMRMGKDGISAYDVVNSFPEKKLADLIYELGDERNSRKIAKEIILYRKKNKIETTTQLASIISSVTRRQGKIHPATKTFQAIRIYINDELGELKKILNDIKDIIKIGGRLVIVSFHSLEDRIVKFFLKENKDIFTILTKKVIKPQYQEIRKNPRARSSKLRAAIYKGDGNE